MGIQGHAQTIQEMAEKTAQLYKRVLRPVGKRPVFDAW